MFIVVRISDGAVGGAGADDILLAQKVNIFLLGFLCAKRTEVGKEWCQAEVWGLPRRPLQSVKQRQRELETL
jgi:hypothetical protein